MRQKHHLIRSVAPAVLASRSPWTDANVTLSTGLYWKGMCGLMNQHMKLLVFLTVAIGLRVNQVVIPLAVSRDSFDTAAALWQEEPASSLWDIPSIQALLRGRDINTTVASDNLIPSDAVHMPRSTHAQLGVLLDMAKGKVDARLGELRGDKSSAAAPLATTTTAPGARRLGGTSQPGGDATPATPQHQVWLHADNLFWMLETLRLPLYADVARAVGFNPLLVQLAATIAADLRATSATGTFNGLHLRVEKDWTDSKKNTPERVQADMDEYLDLMRTLRFSQSPCYIASGIFDPATGAVDRRLYGEHELWLQRNASIALPLLNRHTSIRGLLPYKGLAALHSEQAALLDFLVLQHADAVVGFGPSSFSFNLLQYRRLVGRPRDSTRLVNAARLGYFALTAGMHV